MTGFTGGIPIFGTSRGPYAQAKPNFNKDSPDKLKIVEDGGSSIACSVLGFRVQGSGFYDNKETSWECRHKSVYDVHNT